MKRIAVATATRAEYGLLYPVIRRIMDDPELELDLIVTGAHLSERQGMTIEEIRKDGVPISHEIPILGDDDSAYGAASAMAEAVKGFAACFEKDRPDIIVIMGDRTEMLGAASAAMIERVPIAHIGGGDITEGAVDDCVRHAITKMSSLHFTSTETYRNRVIQLGEVPGRVLNAGSLGTENILTQELAREDEIRADAGIPEGMPYAVVTFHPVTLEGSSVKEQMEEMLYVMENRTDMFFLITGSNADAGGDEANATLREFAAHHDNAAFIQSLGMRRYLGAVEHAAFVMGNSSSGMIEAPVLGTPTVNIGDRQRGRLIAETVICCPPERGRIDFAVDRALSMKHERSDMFGDGNSSLFIIDAIKSALTNGIDLKKGFYDVY